MDGRKRLKLVRRNLHLGFRASRLQGFEAHSFRA